MFWVLKRTSHRDGFLSTHNIIMFWLRNKKNNFLNETVLLSTHNMCFGLEIRKIIFSYAYLSGGLADILGMACPSFLLKRFTCFYHCPPVERSHLIRIHNRFHSDCKYILTIGMLKVNKIKLGEECSILG